MRLITVIVTIIIITGTHSYSYAGCNCDDWMKMGGYCVDYIKTKIPTFPIPQNTTEIAALKNKDIPEVAEGDVAMFNISNYWHVAYVEKVNLNQQGDATSIDVSEMNFGGQLSFSEFKNKWNPKSRSEWKRALCCGVTNNYDQTGSRNNVLLDTVKQIWSPVSTASEDVKGERNVTIVDKVRDVFNRFFLFTEKEL